MSLRWHSEAPDDGKPACHGGRIIQFDPGPIFLDFCSMQDAIELALYADAFEPQTRNHNHNLQNRS